MSKSFYGSYALKNVDFDLREGEVHILCGENGAGKSTLMKILSGNYHADGGEILLDGKPVHIQTPMDAEKYGIAIVYQEMSLSPTVSVAENTFLGREKVRCGLINRKEMYKETKKYLDIVGADVDPNRLVSLLTAAQMQFVQIARALSINARIIIMDEPCSSLSEKDSESLFDIIRDLRSKGISIIYIDHRMENFFKIGDRITILRDAERIDTCDIDKVTKDEIIQKMVGRSISNIYPKEGKLSDQVVLKVEGIQNKKLQDISFEVKAGEVFGLGGLVGAGRSEIVRAIFGADPVDKNAKIFIDGKEIKIKSISDAIHHGIAYIPEDRKRQGLVLTKSIPFNTSLACIERFLKGPFISMKRSRKPVQEVVAKLNIRYKGLNVRVLELSGGNQQKVVIAKWLLLEKMRVLLLDEPTRGIDVGAKYEIYKLIGELSRKGIAIVLITSELPELIGLCDRIAIVASGAIQATLDRAEFSQEKIISYCV